jgi:SNF2 family DNA or RNA helicase
MSDYTFPHVPRRVDGPPVTYTDNAHGAMVPEAPAIPKPWPHQQDGIDWALARSASYLHLTMGAGKSRIVVDIADESAAMRVLIVCPKSVVASVWPGQFKQWSVRPWAVAATTLLGSSVATRIKKAEAIGAKATYERRPCVTVINYDAMRSKAAIEWLKKQRWDLCVFDEAQKLKSHTGSTSKLAAQLTRKACKRVVGLSGTPMPHSPMDIFAQFRAIAPDVFGGSYYRFRARYAQMGGYKMKEVKGFQHQTEMTERMSAVMFSPPGDAVNLNLPPHRHEIRTVDLSPEARRLYDALNSEVVAGIEQGIINPANGLVKLLRMQQLCSGLAVVEEPPPLVGSEPAIDADLIARLLAGTKAMREDVEVCTAKRDALRDILESTDEPVVVFGQFRQDMKSTKAACAAAGATMSELSGQANELAEWKAGKTRVLGVQIASGAEGIDLTRARLCVYLSTGFNMGTYLQSLARVHRPGQTRPVVYYHIHARKTVDDIVWRVLAARGDLVASVLAQVQHSAG